LGLGLAAVYTCDFICNFMCDLQIAGNCNCVCHFTCDFVSDVDSTVIQKTCNRTQDRTRNHMCKRPLKAHLHGGMSHGTSHRISHGTRIVPQKVRGTFRVNGGLALAMVLWYHPCLISERSQVRFPAGCKKTFSLPSFAVSSPTDVTV
jgi:hypothetical protein